MNHRQVMNLSDLASVRVQQEDLDILRANPAFQRQEQGLVDILDAVYTRFVQKDVAPEEQEYLRGQMAAFRMILRIPDAIQDEIDADKVNPIPLTPEDEAESKRFVRERFYGDNDHG